MTKTDIAEGLCVVVPCFNEEEALEPFMQAIQRIEKDLDPWLNSPICYVFVDDGSSDHTLEILRTFHRENPHVHYVSFSRNFGKEAGLLAGLTKSLSLDCKYVTVMDADLQDPPDLLSEMFKTMEATNCDVVATYRKSREGEPAVRSWFAHRFYKFINRLSSVEMKDGARDFRLMKRSVVEAVVSMPERGRFSKGLFQWVGFKVEWLGFENVERKHGVTHWSFWSLVKYAIDGIVAFSAVPLEAISVAGLVLCLASLCFLVFIVIRTLAFGDPTDGWPSLVCIITFLSGLQLFGMGIIGLYMSKIYGEVKGRPVYIVEEEA
ncbi:MAG: glycosyltransferase family 2 protein [Atopobiaceae bacterium]|jgi:glucosyltransferase